MFPPILGLGATLAGIEWALAYRSNQFEHGGDWQPGTELLVFTGIVAVTYFLIWLGLALLGATVGRSLRRRRGSRLIR